MSEEKGRGAEAPPVAVSGAARDQVPAVAPGVAPFHDAAVSFVARDFQECSADLGVCGPWLCLEGIGFEKQGDPVSGLRPQRRALRRVPRARPAPAMYPPPGGRTVTQRLRPSSMLSSQLQPRPSTKNASPAS